MIASALTCSFLPSNPISSKSSRSRAKFSCGTTRVLPRPRWPYSNMQRWLFSFFLSPDSGNYRSRVLKFTISRPSAIGSNRCRFVAPRGKILDRDGRVIVGNHSTWSLILSRENLRQEHLHEIADGLRLDYDDLVRKVRRLSSRPEIRTHHHQGRINPVGPGLCRSASRLPDVSRDGTDRVAAAALSRRTASCRT